MAPFGASFAGIKFTFSAIHSVWASFFLWVWMYSGWPEKDEWFPFLKDPLTVRAVSQFTVEVNANL